MSLRDDAGAGIIGTSPFTCYDDGDVRALIEDYPLAWVCARRTGEASLLPLVGDYDENGRLTLLIGHMARSNPLHKALAADRRALLLFTGPQAYISPEHAGLRDWAPTWNYAQLRLEVDLLFEPERIDEALDLLVDKMEAGRASPWTSGELGGRYIEMRRAIIAFRAEVTKLNGIFKLGQDETDEALRSILAHHPDPAMVSWMRRLNRGRL